MPISVALSGISFAYMKHPAAPLILTMSQVEELINGKLKEQTRRVMPVLCDRVSKLFTTKMMSIVIPCDMINWVILDYMGEVDPIHHIQKHESSLLGRTSNDNHFMLMFQATLTGNASYWFAGLPRRQSHLGQMLRQMS